MSFWSLCLTLLSIYNSLWGGFSSICMPSLIFLSICCRFCVFVSFCSSVTSVIFYFVFLFTWYISVSEGFVLCVLPFSHFNFLFGRFPVPASLLCASVVSLHLYSVILHFFVNRWLTFKPDILTLTSSGVEWSLGVSKPWLCQQIIFSLT